MHIMVPFLLLFIGMTMFTFTVRHITQFMPFGILLAALGLSITPGILGACGWLWAQLAQTYL